MTNGNMDKLLMEMKAGSFGSPPSQQPYFVLQPPPSSSNFQSSEGFNLNNKVSPSILLIIIILAIIFSVSTLLHLLVRFLLRPPPTRDPYGMDNLTALQGQLQQLFHLHDAGVDQSFIDTTLPVFNYKAIIGLKSPFYCGISLSSLPLIPGYRPAMSECGSDSRREFKGFDQAFKSLHKIQGCNNNNIISNNAVESKAFGSSSRGESFSILKIWLRGKKEKPNLATMQSSRRAFSFRFGDDLKQTKNGAGAGAGNRRTICEIDIGRWENGGSEIGCDLDNQSFHRLDSQANPHSFARTLCWLMGRQQNKVVHSSFSSSNV